MTSACWTGARAEDCGGNPCIPFCCGEGKVFREEEIVVKATHRCDESYPDIDRSCRDFPDKKKLKITEKLQWFRGKDPVGTVEDKHFGGGNFLCNFRNLVHAELFFGEHNLTLQTNGSHQFHYFDVENKTKTEEVDASRICRGFNEFDSGTVQTSIGLFVSDCMQTAALSLIF